MEGPELSFDHQDQKEENLVELDQGFHREVGTELELEGFDTGEASFEADFDFCPEEDY